ncbi:sugar ABC transporter permease [Paenibacillus sp. ISL-20]|uniref:carbohydrate ABC transporter permease n=1 Tax=Paenibacillus sp. ISL-20 TaxID=2819163 RepID=UPI001BED0C7B|nr:sugar ABC transporter permease [Paenibacillus sp. ISL-20]MBT2760337.1 sugar ABC transporter permease [Paenibacillus sp. ISL-20]
MNPVTVKDPSQVDMSIGKRKRKLQNELLATGFLAPYFSFFILFSIVPIFYGLFVSFHDWTLIGKEGFVGLQNYLYALKDSDFWASLWNTTYFALISTPFMIVTPFLLALILDSKVKGKTFLRTVFFMPNVLSVAVVSFVWIFLLAPYSGLVNTVLHNLGILSPESEIFWLNEPQLAWISIVMITLWWTQGFNMIVLLAGLQDIPAEHYEAATLDGANAWQRLKFITLPAMRGLLVLITVLQVIASFKVFGQVWLVTRGGPGNETRTMIQYIYETGFTANDLGLSTSMSFIFFVFLTVLSFLQFKIFGKKSD